MRPCKQRRGIFPLSFTLLSGLFCLLLFSACLASAGWAVQDAEHRPPVSSPEEVLSAFQPVLEETEGVRAPSAAPTCSPLPPHSNVVNLINFWPNGPVVLQIHWTVLVFYLMASVSPVLITTLL